MDWQWFDARQQQAAPLFSCSQADGYPSAGRAPFPSAWPLPAALCVSSLIVARPPINTVADPPDVQSLREAAQREEEAGGTCCSLSFLARAPAD